jgi:hypothetical protein
VSAVADRGVVAKLSTLDRFSVETIRIVRQGGQHVLYGSVLALSAAVRHWSEPSC